MTKADPTVLYVEKVEAPITAETVGMELAAGFPCDIAAVLRVMFLEFAEWPEGQVDEQLRKVTMELTHAETIEAAALLRQMLDAVLFALKGRP